MSRTREQLIAEIKGLPRYGLAQLSWYRNLDQGERAIVDGFTPYEIALMTMAQHRTRAELGNGPVPGNLPEQIAESRPRDVIKEALAFILTYPGDMHIRANDDKGNSEETGLSVGGLRVILVNAELGQLVRQLPLWAALRNDGADWQAMLNPYIDDDSGRFSADSPDDAIRQLLASAPRGE